MENTNLYNLVLMISKLTDCDDIKDDSIKSAKYQIADFLIMLIKLIRVECIYTKDELLESEFKDEYWLNAFALASTITGFRKNYLLSGNSNWSFDDYRMELTWKLVDKYEKLVDAYLGQSDFYLNTYVTTMLMNMIYDNNRKNSRPVGSLDESIGEDDITIMDMLISENDTEGECLLRSTVRYASEKLNKLSTKGPLLAMVLDIMGDRDKAMANTFDNKELFLNYYNSEIDKYCREFGIKDSEEYKASSLSDFAKNFNPQVNFNSAQISRWKYIAKTIITPIFLDYDYSPVQVRKKK